MLEVTTEPLLRFVQRRHHVGLYQRLEWVTNETLQLQRMAHEGLGAGTWTGTADSLPTSMKDECLAKLDVSDETHPRLVFESLFKSEEKPTSSSDDSLESATTLNSVADDSTISRLSEDRFCATPAQLSPEAEHWGKHLPESGHPEFSRDPLNKLIE